MRRIQFVFSLVLLCGGIGCGKNSGTPLPVDANQVSGDLMLAPTDGSKLKLSDERQWRAEIRWAESPRFSEEEILALSGVVFLRANSGQIPSEVSGVEFIADMPQHGHGTGNNIPFVRATDSDQGRWTFGNVVFTMQGQWRIRVVATVNGQRDTWTTWIDVK